MVRYKKAKDSVRYRFNVAFDESSMDIVVDDFTKSFAVRDMKKVFGPGLIRFQSHRCWMAIERISVKKS
jgi:hypothetical protein